jgi:hypothetical protein
MWERKTDSLYPLQQYLQLISAELPRIGTDDLICPGGGRSVAFLCCKQEKIDYLAEILYTYLCMG